MSCPTIAENIGIDLPDSSGEEYRTGSSRLDVPYVTTPMKVVRALLELGAVTSDDFLVDMGSGDGRIVLAAAKEYGARGFGVDLNEELVNLSKKYAIAEGVDKNVDFYVRDIFKTDVSAASVVTLYLLNNVNIQLRPMLLADLRPGSRVVSLDFHMGEWRPDKMIHMDVGKYYKDDTHLYLWIIPSKVAGWWQWQLSLLGEDHTFDLDLSQIYQKIDGVVTNGVYNWQIFEAELSGNQIQFSLYGEADNRMIRQDYQGRVDGNTIIGTVKISGTFNQTPLTWQATLKKPHF